jgi:hypothetical protein
MKNQSTLRKWHYWSHLGALNSNPFRILPNWSGKMIYTKQANLIFNVLSLAKFVAPSFSFYPWNNNLPKNLIKPPNPTQLKFYHNKTIKCFECVTNV